ncbi:hypothetical protein [Bordetella genomosp. 13]|uniref:hypothetical protein n=1 Tax=Bordetella genomosp. 13 TaxID=463040 RepID=UPI0011A4B04D|nr:hypothetical protein [Bordetella genomosp. 13]
MDTIRIASIRTDDWYALRDWLAAHGWQLQHGGGLDHCWADLGKGTLRICMEYDRWGEGEIAFPAAACEAVLAELPENFRHAYLAHLSGR